MFKLIKRVFIVLVFFWWKINYKICRRRPMLVDLNPEILRYNSFMASLDRCDASCKICLVEYVSQLKKNGSIKYGNINKLVKGINGTYLI